MGRKGEPRIPDLRGSSLRHHSGHLFVDAVTGMVLSRVGHVKAVGYEYVATERGERPVHQVVWEAIHGPIPPRLVINHLNGVKDDNRPVNLEAVTQAENVSHAYRTGLHKTNSAALTGRRAKRRLSDEQLAALRAAPWGAAGPLADEWGISRGHAYNIRMGRKCVN